MDEQIEKRRAYDREWKRQYKLKNPDKVKAKRRARYYKEKKNPEWLKKHKEYMKVYQKEWEKNNPRLVYKREYMKAWGKKHQKRIYAMRRTRPYEKLASSIRGRINYLLKGGYKSAKTEELLGITVKELKLYLEKKFVPGMTWKNYGFYGWHADHIIPLSKFDLTKLEEQKKAFHYTNLQPLWAGENLRKHAKVL